MIAPAKLVRLHDWPERFAAFMLQNIRTHKKGVLTFSWNPAELNARNCCTFASKAVESITGHDLHAEVLAQIGGPLAYRDMVGAYRAIEDLGYDGLPQLMAALLPEKSVLKATQGDLVMVPEETLQGELYLGVADPPFYWVVSTIGLSKGELSRAVKAFAVG